MDNPARRTNPPPSRRPHPNPKSKIENRKSKVPWYLWLNVLHLDAPLITVAWQMLFARTADYELPVTESAILFLAVWIIYAGDRVLDGFRLSVGPTTAARHRFSRRHARPLAAGILLAATLGALLVVTTLPLRTLLAGSALGSFVVAYFAWNQLAGTRWGRGWLKEAVVSLVFAFGAALTPLVNAFTWPVLGETLGFALLCFANCLLIARLDRDRDHDRGETSIAARFGPTARPSRTLSLVLATIFAICVVIVGTTPVLLSLLASAILLATAPLIERLVGSDAAAAWADLALLTPLPALLVAG